MSGIDTLIEKLEAADGPNYALEIEIFKLIHPEYEDFIQGRGGLIHPQDGEDVRVRSDVRPSNYTASIDAALAFANYMVPGYGVELAIRTDGRRTACVYAQGAKTAVDAHGATVPIALCIAVLKAKRATEVSA